MTTFTIYYGAVKPIRATGKHCVRLLQFAEKFRGWHTFASDRTTRRAIASLQRIGCIEIMGDQFQFVYPKV